VAGAILFVGISFRIHYDPRASVGLWMTPWTRDLNVGTSILDLALWSLPMEQRGKDDRLLLLSGALGIQFTGAAMGHSMRSMATRYHPWPAMAGGKVVVLTGIIRVYLVGAGVSAVAPGGTPGVCAGCPAGTQRIEPRGIAGGRFSPAVPGQKSSHTHLQNIFEGLSRGVPGGYGERPGAQGPVSGRASA
jgi:hypothetical protein